MQELNEEVNGQAYTMATYLYEEVMVAPDNQSTNSILLPAETRTAIQAICEVPEINETVSSNSAEPDEEEDDTQQQLERKYNVKDVLNLLQNRVYPDGMDAITKKGLYRYSKKFIIIDGKLYHAGCKGSLKVIFSAEKMDRVFGECHQLPTGVHVGYGKTLRKIRSRYYFLGLTSYVKEKIQKCDVCQNSPKKRTEPELHPIEVSHPWEVISIDFFGPLPKTAKHKRFVLLITCIFSNWVEAYPLTSKCPDEVASKLFKHMYRYGPPKSILAVQGRDLIKRINTNLFSKIKIKSLVTSLYHPQMIGQVKITNETFKQHLDILSYDAKDQWNILLHRVAYCINTSHQVGSNVTPYHVLFNRPHNMFSEICEGNFDLHEEESSM